MYFLVLERGFASFLCKFLMGFCRLGCVIVRELFPCWDASIIDAVEVSMSHMIST